MNNEQSNMSHQISDSHSSTTMEEKLPEQIMENVLLEGVNSQELLQNTDIVNFSNILANLRYDLSSIMNEDIDEFTFQTICQDLLLKTSENIKIKPPQSNKSQSQQPQPMQNQIDIDDIYAHLKRQPWQYNNYNGSNELNISNDITESKPISKSNKSVTTSGSTGWDSYMSDVCNHKQNNIGNDIDISEHKSENKNESDSELEPGNITIETPNDINESEENELDMIGSDCNVTLMGDSNKNDVVKFKNISKCYSEIFNKNVDNIMNEINENETIGKDCNNNEVDESSDDENDSLIVSNVTLMGHETIQ